MDLYHEKLQQAVELLAAHDLDLWLILARETAEHTDPALKLLGHFTLTWPSAIIVTRSGRALALTGLGDDEAVRRSGLFDEVRAYTQSIGPALVEILQAYDPQRIGINISRSDVSADGLTYGMYLNLCDYLDGTPYRERLTSAEHFVAALRSRKTPQEVARMRAAADLSLRIFTAVGDFLRPGVSERDVAAFVHAQTQILPIALASMPALIRRGVTLARLMRWCVRAMSSTWTSASISTVIARIINGSGTYCDRAKPSRRRKCNMPSTQ